MKIYIDMLFMVNFLMDYFLLKITLLLNNHKNSKLRIILGAVFGGITSVLMFFLEINSFFISIMNIVISWIMILIAYKWTNIKTMYKLIITYYFSTFFVGGVMLGINFLTQTPFFAQSHLKIGVFYANVSFLNFFIFVILAYLLIIFAKQIISLFKKDVNRNYDIIISFKGKKISVHGLMDTGNMLKDPIYQKSVGIITMKTAKRIFSKEVYIIFKENKDNTLKCFEELCKVQKGFFLIPVSTVSQSKNMLIGFVAEKMEYMAENEGNKNDTGNIIVEKPVFAIAQQEILKNTSYDAIL